MIGQVVTALVHRAIDLGHRNLPGLLDLSEADVVEDHGRFHTVVITPAHARGAKPGNPCDCAIAHAVVELPEVYAAIVMRRVAYFLEKDQRGRLKVYRYNSPDQARRLTLRFDRRVNSGRVESTFRPAPPSQSLASQNKYYRRYARRKARGEKPTRSGPVFNSLSYTRTLIPDRMLEPVKQRRV
jgi:hypothetical protein